MLDTSPVPHGNDFGAVCGSHYQPFRVGGGHGYVVYSDSGHTVPPHNRLVSDMSVPSQRERLPCPLLLSPFYILVTFASFPGTQQLEGYHLQPDAAHGEEGTLDNAAVVREGIKYK